MKRKKLQEFAYVSDLVRRNRIIVFNPNTAELLEIDSVTVNSGQSESIQLNIEVLEDYQKA